MCYFQRTKQGAVSVWTVKSDKLDASGLWLKRQIATRPSCHNGHRGPHSASALFVLNLYYHNYKTIFQSHFIFESLSNFKISAKIFNPKKFWLKIEKIYGQKKTKFMYQKPSKLYKSNFWVFFFSGNLRRRHAD